MKYYTFSGKIFGRIAFSFQGESKVALLYGAAMNVGKTTSQELLNFGQGASKREHLLFLTGGNLNSTGTSE